MEAFARRRKPLGAGLFVGAALTGLVVAAQGEEQAPRVGANAAVSSLAPEVPHPCEALAALAVYKDAGVLTRVSETEISLALAANLHGSDCGAPDGYGHEIALRLQLKPSGGRCLLTRADATAKGFGGPPDWSATLAPVAEYDLGSARTSLVIVRNLAAGKAIYLKQDDYSIFEDALPGRPLRDRLQEDEDVEDASFAIKSSGARFWHEEYWLSPISGRPGSKLDPTQPSAWKLYNDWASDHGLRGDLQLLAERTFRTPQVAISLSGTRATEARLVANINEANEPRREMTLRFSRAECQECRPGTPGWSLVGVELQPPATRP